jgi:hypothetical protein
VSAAAVTRRSAENAPLNRFGCQLCFVGGLHAAQQRVQRILACTPSAARELTGAAALGLVSGDALGVGDVVQRLKISSFSSFTLSAGLVNHAAPAGAKGEQTPYTSQVP